MGRVIVVISGVPITQEDLALFDQARADAQWLSGNYGRLQKRYPHRWIAVHMGEVVSTSKRDQMALIRQLRRKGLSSIQIANMRVKYIYPEGEEPKLILLDAA